MNNELKHFGILGMKWGIRRFQNKDGSLTPAGRKRLHKSEENEDPKNQEKEWHQQRVSAESKRLSERKSELEKQLNLVTSEHDLISEKLAWKDLSYDDRWDLKGALELLDERQDVLKTKIRDIDWEKRFNDAYAEYYK